MTLTKFKWLIKGWTLLNFTLIGPPCPWWCQGYRTQSYFRKLNRLLCCQLDRQVHQTALAQSSAQSYSEARCSDYTVWVLLTFNVHWGSSIGLRCVSAYRKVEFVFVCPRYHQRHQIHNRLHVRSSEVLHLPIALSNRRLPVFLVWPLCLQLFDSQTIVYCFWVVRCSRCYEDSGGWAR